MRTRERSTAAIRFILIPSVLFVGTTRFAGAYTPGTGIRGTPHDFTQDNGGKNRVSVGACTFCHTPHRAYETRLIWNHTHTGTYTWGSYNVTSGGTPLPTINSNWQGPTVFCLSCHDGTVARGDVAWFNGQSWTGGNAINPDTVRIGSVSSPFKIDEFLKGMIGNNHPVAAPYPFLRVSSTYNGSTTGGGVNKTKFLSDPTACGIRLFTNAASNQVVAGPTSGKTGIECTSCHGVHNEPAYVVDTPFLRGKRDNKISNGDNVCTTNDVICDKCHIN